MYETSREPSTSGSSRRSTDIPEEVLEFLHSKNFHPEDLENLVDILRHGGSPTGTSPPSAYSSRSSMRHDVRSPRRPNFRRHPETGASRDRRMGKDIKIFILCIFFSLQNYKILL